MKIYDRQRHCHRILRLTLVETIAGKGYLPRIKELGPEDRCVSIAGKREAEMRPNIRFVNFRVNRLLTQDFK